MKISIFSFVALAKAFAYLFKPPNSKLFGYRYFALAKSIVGFAHTHDL